jgi:hypothetical protein
MRNIDRIRETCPELAHLAIRVPLFGAFDSKGNGSSGPARMAQKFGTSYLGSVPMDNSLLACGEQGQGLLENFPGSLAARSLNEIVVKVENLCKVNGRKEDRSSNDDTVLMD